MVSRKASTNYLIFLTEPPLSLEEGVPAALNYRRDDKFLRFLKDIFTKFALNPLDNRLLLITLVQFSVIQYLVIYL
jgi:hypothetical protein